MTQSPEFPKCDVLETITSESSSFQRKYDLIPLHLKDKYISALPVQQQKILHNLLVCLTNTGKNGKPSSPIGDLISDKIWHIDADIKDYERYYTEMLDYVAERQKSRHEGLISYMFSSEHYTSYSLDAGNIRSLELFEELKEQIHKEKELAEASHQEAQEIELYRLRMSHEAISAEFAAQISENSDDFLKAKEIRHNTRSIIEKLGDELQARIDEKYANLAAYYAAKNDSDENLNYPTN